MICDNSTKYITISVTLYWDEGTVSIKVPAPDYFVEHLVSSVKCSNRNITMNWFTNFPLTQKLPKDYKLTVIGTIKRNKREFPVEFTDLKYGN